MVHARGPLRLKEMVNRGDQGRNMKEVKMSVIMAQSQYNHAPTTKPLPLDGTPNPFGMPWFLMG